MKKDLFPIKTEEAMEYVKKMEKEDLYYVSVGGMVLQIDKIQLFPYKKALAFYILTIEDLSKNLKESTSVEEYEKIFNKISQTTVVPYRIH